MVTGRSGDEVVGGLGGSLSDSGEQVAIGVYPSNTDLLAVTQHQVTLPAAVRYGTVRVTTYGGRSVPGFPDIGVILYQDHTGDPTAHGGILKAADGWHAGARVSAENYLQGRTFRWWAGTTFLLK